MPSPAFRAMQSQSQMASPFPTSEEQGSAPSVGEITIPDTLADSLANANKHLRETMNSGLPVDDNAVSQMRVFSQMIDALGQSAPPTSPIGPPGGPGLSQAGPGGLPAAGPPGSLPFMQ